jgi:hypothetical protein
MHTDIHTTENSEAKVLSKDEKPTETTIENGRKDADAADTVAEIAEATATPSSANKSKARRQSLNKKESKAKMSNIHAQLHQVEGVPKMARDCCF